MLCYSCVVTLLFASISMYFLCLWPVQVSGNKMTAANLAVIFGPNLLQKERGADKDLSPQAMGIEDSAAIISVTLLLIQHYKRLFTVREGWRGREEGRTT